MKILLAVIIVFGFALLVAKLGVSSFGSLSSDGNGSGAKHGHKCGGNCGSCDESVDECTEKSDEENK